MLVYGIPEFRLPKAILQAEVDYLLKLGVRLKTSFVVGKTATLQDLRAEGFDAVFVGTGAGLPVVVGRDCRMSSEALSRALRLLACQGILRVTRSEIRVTDPVRLKTVAGAPA